MRIKRGVTSHAKHKKLLRQTRGFRMTRHRLIKVAREAYLHAGEYAFAGRKNRKRDFRRLWISRISEAVKSRGLSYSSFIHLLKEQNIDLNRKVLANLLVDNPKAFEEIVDKVQSLH